MNNIDRYAVIGHGIGHSRSPRIHALFAAQTGQALEYGLLDVPADGFAAAVRSFVAAGGQGLNVTVPFKEAAAALADALTPRAQQAGAVNTLARRADGSLLGDNTDGAGLIRDLAANLGCTLRGARVLLLGAGGAARGIIAPLLAAGVVELAIANHNPARAAALAREFAALGPVQALSAAAIAGPAAPPYDLVLNATSASLRGELPAVPPGAVAAQTLCYDLAYGTTETAFQRWARDAGAARTAMGLGMLVEQAAESFLLWRGVRPETAAVRAALTAGADS